MKYSKGVYKSRLYRIWTGIIDRCTHRRNNLSKHYNDGMTRQERRACQRMLAKYKGYKYK